MKNPLEIPEAATAKLRDYLASVEGHQLMECLRKNIPNVPVETIAQAALRGAKMAGYMECMEDIERIAKINTTENNKE